LIAVTFTTGFDPDVPHDFTAPTRKSTVLRSGEDGGLKLFRKNLRLFASVRNA